MRSRTQHVQASSRPRLGEPLSPKREHQSLNPKTSRPSEKHESAPETRFYNSRLDEMDSPGRDLQSSLSVHAYNSPKRMPNQSKIIPKQHSIITQHKTMASKHQTCYFIHSYYPNSRLNHLYPIPYQNPHSLHIPLP